MLVTQGIQAADKAAHACPRNDINRNTKLFHIFYHAQMRQAAGSASCEDEAYRRPVLADGIHPGTDLCEGDGVGNGIGAGENLRKSVERKQA